MTTRKLPLSHEECIKLGPPKTYDNTLRTQWRDCPRKFYWERRGYTYRQKPMYFIWGEAWHQIKRTWYGSGGPWHPVGTPEWTDCARRALAAGLQYWDDSGGSDTAVETRALLEDRFGKYLRQHPTETFVLIEGGAEQGWVWPISSPGGTSYLLGGSIDGYIEWPGMGQLVLEEKTTGIWISDFYMRQWNFSSQVTQYDWFLVNFLNISPDEAGVLMNHCCKRSSNSGSTPIFARDFQRRTEEDLLEFERDVICDIHHIEDAFEQVHFPKTTSVNVCVGGLGKSPCLFQGLCLSGLSLEVADPLAFNNIGVREESWAPWGRGVQKVYSADARRNPVGKAGESRAQEELEAKLNRLAQWRNKS